jgi:hemin uptake protein HemP
VYGLDERVQAGVHASHPIQELGRRIYGPVLAVDPPLGARVRQALKHPGQALDARVTPDQYRATVRDVIATLDAGVRRVVPDGERRRPDVQVRVILALLQAVEEEYDEAYVERRIQVEIEYQDAWGFLQRARALWERLANAGSVPAATRGIVPGEFDKLAAALPGVRPPTPGVSRDAVVASLQEIMRALAPLAGPARRPRHRAHPGGRRPREPGDRLSPGRSTAAKRRRDPTRLQIQLDELYILGDPKPPCRSWWPGPAARTCSCSSGSGRRGPAGWRRRRSARPPARWRRWAAARRPRRRPGSPPLPPPSSAESVSCAGWPARWSASSSTSWRRPPEEPSVVADPIERRSRQPSPDGAAAPWAVRRVPSAALFRDEREIVIVHQGQEYRLRITRAEKLLLTK